MGSHEKDHHKFQHSVEDEDKTGSKSELLLQVLVQAQEQRDKATDEITPGGVRNGQPDETCEAQITSPGGRVFSRKGHEPVDLERQRSHFQQDSGLEPNSCSIGLCSSTTSKQYPCKDAIVVFFRGMCSQQKPKLVGDKNRVVVYEPIQQENGSLRPAILCFTKNMEAEVPKELVKIGRDD